MKTTSPEQIIRYADMFNAIGTEARLRIMRLLLSAHPEGMVVGEIQTELDLSLTADGFENIDIEPTQIYRAEDARAFLQEQGLNLDEIASQVDGKFMSAFIRARKPAEDRSCCGPTCCN